MSPQVIYISSDQIPIEESWQNRTQGRANARNTPIAELDPGRTISIANRFTAKPTAVALRDALHNEDKIILGVRGSLALLDDDGNPGDPIQITDGWIAVEPQTRWNQLVKVDDNRAIFFCYSTNYTSLSGPGSGSTSAYFKAFNVSISNNQLSIGSEIPLAGPTYSGSNSVPGGIIARKHFIEFIGNDLSSEPRFASAFGGGTPSTNQGATQLFTLDEGGQTETFSGGTSQWLGGSGPDICLDIAYDEARDGFHVLFTDGQNAGTGKINFLQNDGINGYQDSGHTVDIQSISSLGAGLTDKNANMLIDSQGRVIIQLVNSVIVVLNYNISSGYTLNDDGSAGNLLSAFGDERAYEFGLFNPPFDGEGTLGGSGGNHQQVLFNMGIANGVDDYVAIDSAFFDSFGLGIDSSGNIINPVDDRIIEDPAFSGFNDAVESVSLTYAKKDNDTIYGFYCKWDQVDNVATPMGIIMRK